MRRRKSVEYVSAIVEIIEIILFSLLALVALLAVLLITVSLLPKDKPLRMLLVALSKPIGIMVGLGTVALPIEFIPAIDAVYDLLGFVLVGRRAGLFAFHNPRGVSCCFRRRRRLCRGPDSHLNSCASLFGLLLTDGRVASGDDLWR
jgi:hypothetical protein